MGGSKVSIMRMRLYMVLACLLGPFVLVWAATLTLEVALSPLSIPLSLSTPCPPPLSTPALTSPLDGYLSLSMARPPPDGYLPSRCLPPLSTPALPPLDARPLDTWSYPLSSTAAAPSRTSPPLPTSSSPLDAYLHPRGTQRPTGRAMARHTSQAANPTPVYCTHRTRSRKEKEKGQEKREERGSRVMAGRQRSSPPP